jgi:hypothetical protein
MAGKEKFWLDEIFRMLERVLGWKDPKSAAIELSVEPATHADGENPARRMAAALGSESKGPKRPAAPKADYAPDLWEVEPPVQPPAAEIIETVAEPEPAPKSAASDAAPLVEAEARLTAPAETEPAATKSPSPLETLLAETRDGTAWTHTFAEGDKPCAPAPFYKHALVDVEGVVCLRLDLGEPEAASGGLTQGYNFRVSDELELAASGNPIAIKIIARSAGTAPSRFACSYSTNEVGNSGWKWQAVSHEWAAYTFDYRVPKMIKGQGDFLGLLPAPEGEPAVEIAGVEIKVNA